MIQKTAKKALKAAGVVCLAVFALIVFELWYSYRYLTVTEYTVTSEKIEKPVRLALLSDLHGSMFGDGNRELIEAICSREPDAIVMAGDMINRYDENPDEALQLIEALAQRAPVYYALGNHENDYMLMNGSSLLDQIEQAGAKLLELTYEDIELGGQRLRIGGMYDYAFALDRTNSTNPERMDPQVYSFLTTFENTPLFTLMVSHRPESFIFGQASDTWEIDLTVHGHAHGGQVVLPFIGGLWAGDQGYFPEYVHGVYEKGKLQLLVTSGLGSSRTSVPRLNNPPEIVILELAPKTELPSEQTEDGAQRNEDGGGISSEAPR